MKSRTITIAFALLLIAAGYLLAQATPGTTTNQEASRPGQIVRLPSGPAVKEIALRMEGMHGKRAFGTLVVRVDGRWVDVELASYNTLVGK